MGITGLGFSIIVAYLLFLLLILAGYVFMVIISWRFMRAHESLAGSIKEIAAGFKIKE